MQVCRRNAAVKLDLIPATQQHFVRVFGMTCPVPFEGMAAMRGDVVMAIGGVAVEEDGELTAFLWCKAQARGPWMFRAVKRGLRKLATRGCGPVRAYCDSSIARSDVFLERLGFVKTGETKNNMEIWRCKNG